MSVFTFLDVFDITYPISTALTMSNVTSILFMKLVMVEPLFSWIYSAVFGSLTRNMSWPARMQWYASCGSSFFVKLPIRSPESKPRQIANHIPLLSISFVSQSCSTQYFPLTSSTMSTNTGNITLSLLISSYTLLSSEDRLVTALPRDHCYWIKLSSLQRSFRHQCRVWNASQAHHPMHTRN